MFPYLMSQHPHPSLGVHADTYGRLIGSWRGTYYDPRPDGDERGPLEVHFAWALEGRAVQDVWIAPAPPLDPGRAYKRQMYGTTIRVFDPVAQVWRVDWWNPSRSVHCALVGRRVGDQIVQTGYWDDRPQRWRFLDISARSFRWQAHRLSDDGESWHLVTEFTLSRQE